MAKNNELLEALTILEQEKNISKETLLSAIQDSLVTACKNHFGTSDNVEVLIDPDTCEYKVFQKKTVVETVENPVEEISIVNALSVILFLAIVFVFITNFLSINFYFFKTYYT